MTRDALPGLLAAIERAAKAQVLVGIPAANATRDDDPSTNNAALGYIHEYGAPEAHIPARPWLIPGVRAAQDRIGDRLERGIRAVLAGRGVDVYRAQLAAAGQETRDVIVDRIRSGIGPALADATLRARARRVPSRTAEREELAARAAGEAPGMALVTPLIDTGKFVASITYVLIG
jgi:hypothetical protein